MVKNEKHVGDVEVRDMVRQEKLEQVALVQFSGLLPEYHKRMAEAAIHALANWVPDEYVDDALNDIRYFSNRVRCEVDGDVRRSRYK